MKEAIISRRSQRSFTGQELRIEDIQKIKNYIENEVNLVGVYGNKINIHMINTIGKNVEKISTYGVIKKAPNYLVAVTGKSKEALIDCGYVFEKLVLYLEANGIGTCWLGGTFKRSQLNVPLGEGQFIPIISPIGYGASKKTFSDKTVRRLAKADSRIEFDKLFFENNFKETVTQIPLRERLEYVRLAPSASNKQPWRIVVDDKDIGHLYLERTPNYGNGKLGYDIQMVDMGIAMCHYEYAKGSVEFVTMDQKFSKLSDFSDYIISMK